MCTLKHLYGISDNKATGTPAPQIQTETQAPTPRPMHTCMHSCTRVLGGHFCVLTRPDKNFTWPRF